MHASRDIQILATVLFGLAILHTFLSSYFRHRANRYPEGSIKENLFHLLGEVEVVFGLWSGVLFLLMIGLAGSSQAFEYMESRNFTEPLFVLAIMTVAATRPVIAAVQKIIFAIAKVLPMHRELAIYGCCLCIGPLLGSFITEPAAMTVIALILKDRYFDRSVSVRFKYLTIAILFVNVSIGGAMTPFAAPPVLMVAAKWGWNLQFMFTAFGWKVLVATLVNAGIGTVLLSAELKNLSIPDVQTEKATPWWLTAVHLFFLGTIVMTAHHPVIFMGAFLFFLGVATITQEYQDPLKIKESLLVAFFLGGLVVLGGLQSWWLEPLLLKLDTFPLFIGTTMLTALTDNAALTYLGSQVEGISDAFKYALVSGAIAGGGLTVIANAPNPAGYAILQETFGGDGIKPLKLLLYALPPTVVAMICLWMF